MISWCAYCQKFLGEKPPLENRKFSHGMCKACAKVGLFIPDEQSTRMDYLVDLNRRFWVAGESENHAEIIKLAEEGMSQGVRPIDILYGFAGPMLYKVGELWARNEITHLDEQRFTRSCETLVELVSKRISQIRDPDSKTRSGTVLLTNVEGNVHTLGLHFLSIGLASLGITSKIVLPALKPEAFVGLAVREHFQAIGISVALASQSLELNNMLSAFKNETAFNGKIVVGGSAVSEKIVNESTHPNNPNVHFLPSPNFDEIEREFWIFKN